MAFLTVWGAIMVGAYLLGGETADSPTDLAADWVSETPPAADHARLR
jgi:hypothetical protein